MAERALRKQLAAFNATYLGAPKPKTKKKQRKPKAKSAESSALKKDLTERNLHALRALDAPQLAETKRKIASQVYVVPKAQTYHSHRFLRNERNDKECFLTRYMTA